MRTLKGILLYMAIPTVFFISCKKDKVETGPEPVPTGKISGKIVAANNTTPISNATVFAFHDGHLYATQSDKNGIFLLQAPAGNQHVTIQSGDGTMFRTEIDVVVKENETTEISGQAVALTQVASLAYIPGVYDRIENILIDSLGYTATAITPLALNTLDSITPYDAIFINCTYLSDLATTTATADQNLADYVANGGSLYVSDYAINYLVGRPVSSAAPCSQEKTGGFIADSLICSRMTGDIGSLLNVSITSPSLQAYMNATSINEIYYNLGAWEKINTLDANFWETMVADQTGNPLLIRTNQYTNPAQGIFHTGNTANTAYSLVCAPITNGQHITLSVRNSDVAAFISAGASMGSCDNPNGAGLIYYTTFHNEPNGQIAPNIKNILQYVILNL